MEGADTVFFLAVLMYLLYTVATLTNSTPGLPPVGGPLPGRAPLPPPPGGGSVAQGSTKF